MTIWKSFSANVTLIHEILSIFNYRNRMEYNKYIRFVYMALTRKGYCVCDKWRCDFTNKTVYLTRSRIHFKIVEDQ